MQGITIKDFKKGDKVYILSENRGRDEKPSINETTVASVGRIYVTTSDGSWQAKYRNWNAEYLYEKVEFGESRLLFKSRKEAEEYIEKCDLALWLGCISTFDARKYSVEQLRKVKEILSVN